jgi:hypothetical protein
MITSWHIDCTIHITCCTSSYPLLLAAAATA